MPKTLQENLLDELKKLGCKKETIEICLVGGANVPKKENDTIADKLFFCIFELMKQNKISIKRTSLFGYKRYTAKLCLHVGLLTFTLGEKSEAE